MDEYYKNLGKRLKESRKYKGLNQDQLAKMLNIGSKTYWNYEKGQTKIENELVIKIADICGVVDTWLLTGDESNGKFIDNNIINEKGIQFGTKAININGADPSDRIRISELEKENEYLKQRITDLEKIIKLHEANK